MTKTASLCIALVLYLPISLAIARQEDAPGARDLLARGDELAEKKEYEAALGEYIKAYEILIPKLRGLSFKKPIDAELMTREELADYLIETLHEEIPEEELYFWDRSIKAFRFAPPDFDLESVLLATYTEEIAGFYDTKTKKLRLIVEEEKPKEKGLLARWFGRSSAFDREEQKATLSHEMTHALADQHFDIHGLDESIEEDDDMGLALTALIEGEATLLMMGDEDWRNGYASNEYLDFPPEAMDKIGGIEAFLNATIGGKNFRKAPRVIRETMLFPYTKGLVFVLHATNNGGWPPIDQAFRDPPTSTEQILHPSRYYGERDTPTRIHLPDLAPQVDGDWRKLGENVLGELQIKILLDDKEAAAGWDGDRYAVFENTEGKLAVAWFTVWDSPDDAAEFASSRPEGWTDPIFERRDARVAVVDGFSKRESEALIEALFRSRTEPKSFPRPSEKH